MKRRKQLRDLDAFVAYIKKLPRADTHLLNVPRYLEMQRAYRSLDAWVKENAGTISTEIIPDMGTGAIQVEASDLIWYQS